MKFIKRVLVSIIKPYNWKWLCNQRITVGPLYFWLWQLYSLVVTCTFFYGINAYVLFVGDKRPDVDQWLVAVIIGFLIVSLYLYHFGTCIGMAIKRLADADFKWYTIYWLLLPCLGTIILLSILCLPKYKQSEGESNYN